MQQALSAFFFFSFWGGFGLKVEIFIFWACLWYLSAALIAWRRVEGGGVEDPPPPSEGTRGGGAL